MNSSMVLGGVPAAWMRVGDLRILSIIDGKDRLENFRGKAILLLLRLGTAALRDQD
jgi:hypothetical protein